jgi:hypothetical protein
MLARIWRCAQFAPWGTRFLENIDALRGAEGGVQIGKIEVKLQRIYLGNKLSVGLAAA